MNRLIAQQIKQINQYIDEIGAQTTETREQLENVAATREELQRKAWSLGKELAVYKEQANDMPALRKENEKLRKQNAEFIERLRRVLQYTRALAVDYHP